VCKKDYHYRQSRTRIRRRTITSHIATNAHDFIADECGEEILDQQGKTLKQKAVHELREYFGISLYLFIFLGMFIVYKAIILREHEIDFAAHGVALINALVLGKFMLIAKAFHPGKSADDKPLIYPTLLKAGISALVLAVCKILEDAIVGYFHGRSFLESIADLGGGNWTILLVFTVMLFVVLLPLTAFGELDRVVGEGRVGRLFFRQRDLSKPFDQQAV
jgi:hypothetical protein